MKACEICENDDPDAIVAICDGCHDFHALCRECAGPYLTQTLFSQSKVPAIGDRVKCVNPACYGMLEVEDLTRGMDAAEKTKVDAQMARSTINLMSPTDAYNVVYCDYCEEYYLRDNPSDTCFRCVGRGKLTAVYVPNPNEADAESAALIKQTSMPCLKCGANISRTGGCNHMTCSRCRHEFCYVCGRDWSAEPRCSSYRCRAQEQAKHRLLRARRNRSRAQREAEADGDAVCYHCAMRGVRGANCPHVPLMPGGPNCQPNCPRDCTCDYSAWITAWLQFRPRPGADPEYFNPAALEKATIAHFACVRTRGTSCSVCGLFGHSPDGQSGRRFCPLIEMVNHAENQASGAGPSNAA